MGVGHRGIFRRSGQVDLRLDAARATAPTDEDLVTVEREAAFGAERGEADRFRIGLGFVLHTRVVRRVGAHDESPRSGRRRCRHRFGRRRGRRAVGRDVNRVVRHFRSCRARARRHQAPAAPSADRNRSSRRIARWPACRSRDRASDRCPRSGAVVGVPADGIDPASADDAAATAPDAAETAPEASGTPPIGAPHSSQ